MGTNTLHIEVRPHGDGTRTITRDANAQTSIPIVDVMLPSGRGDHLSIPQVNLSISGYEPDSLRNSHGRSPSSWDQEISIMLQLDGPASLPTRDPIGRRAQEDSRLAGQEYSQGGTYVQGASIPRRREYPGESSDDDNVSRRPNRDQRPLREEDIQIKVEGHLIEEDILIEDLLGEDIPIEMEDCPKEVDTKEEDPLMVEDPLMEMEDPLDLLVDKDHQVLKDPLDQ